MTPDVYRVLPSYGRSGDWTRVFLYKDKPIIDVKTAFDKACCRAGIKNRVFGFHHKRMRPYPPLT